MPRLVLRPVNRYLSILAATTAATALGGVAQAEFVSGVQSFTQGTTAFANGVPGPQYADPTKALGRPSPDTAFGPVEAFNPAFAPGEIVALGLSGQITLTLPTSVSVAGQSKVGIFTAAGLNYGDDPMFSGIGKATDPARTFASDEYGAERTAIVEVASNLNDFRSLGRVVFNVPTQGYSNQTLAFQTPANGQVSDFDKPFTGSLSSFSNLTESGIESLLDGSAGGTWLDVSAIGLSDIRYVRISQTQWMLSDGTLKDQQESSYDYGTPEPFVKPADLFIDGVNVVPEPCGIALISFAACLLGRGARRGGRR